MSGANSVVRDITLDELSRLIRILGMLGSNSDGEALAAAKFAVRWVAEHQTSWEALLVPEPEPGVLAVVAEADPDAAAKLKEAAYEAGFREGMKVANSQWAAQVKAQAAMASGFNPHQQSRNPTGQGAAFANMAAQAPQPLQGGAAAVVPPWAQAKPQGPVRASGGLGGGYPAGSWQAVAQALLDLDASGVPAVFRGSREQQFVADVLARGFASLTPAQEDWLRAIAQRNGLSW